ncbi:hypothetical protein HDU81_003053 [Chytriomyces hyalinus]|nr:hypothetical protein HDU81_003053 [Chytriomyces hyalinus]
MFASRFLRSVKTSTGLTGLAVHPNAQPELVTLYQRILHTAQRLPESSAYRRSVDAVTRQRLAVAAAESDVSVIESKIGGGHIEELLKQAEDEISLIQNMAEWEAWKPLEAKIPEGQWSSATV